MPLVNPNIRPSNPSINPSPNPRQHPTSPTASPMTTSPPLTCFTNCQLIIGGEIIPQDIYFSAETGLITGNYYYLKEGEGVRRVDLGGRIVGPGFLEVQTNGMAGVHFSNLGQPNNTAQDSEALATVAKMQFSSGVTGFYATIPTVPKHRWPQILPVLTPRSFPNGADLLGAHVEGPYLSPIKKGAHNATYLLQPSDTDASPAQIYGKTNLSPSGSIKLLTLAPELPGAVALIGHLRETHPHITLSLGHSPATYAEGQAAIHLGARMLTHAFNAMSPLHHRDPGLPGLMHRSDTWYSLIADGIHLHPAICALAFRANPTRCVLVTDSIELAGLEDGVHEGHGQIQGRQRKEGNRVTLEGTDTLVGSCITLDKCVRNLVAFSECSLAEAVRCVTENVVDMLGEAEREGRRVQEESMEAETVVVEGAGRERRDASFDVRKRGKLEPGRRADFVIMDEMGNVLETWMAGKKVWSKASEL